MPLGTSQNCYCQHSGPQGEPPLTHAFAEDPPTLVGRSGSVFFVGTVLSPGT